MNIEQFVMAYGVEHDRLRAVLPDGYESLRPVLRINAEIADEKTGYLEFNTAVKKDNFKGWLNIGFWNDIPFEKHENIVIFRNNYIEISFRRVGAVGSCPAEKDNGGCFFIADSTYLRKPEKINAHKEFCDCEFRWIFDSDCAHGVSQGKTLPAIPCETKKIYPEQGFTVENAAKIPCEQVLGTYAVDFERS